MNFSIGNKKSKDIEAEEFDDVADDDDDDDSSSSSSGNGFNDKDRIKLIKTLGFILLGFVILIMFLFVITAGSSSAKSFEDIENIMVEAAEKYFAAHPESLPQADGTYREIEVSALVADGRMKDLSSYTSELCTGRVKVERINSTYTYTPNLNCGSAYTSAKLSEKIQSDNQVTSSGYGLYSRNGYLVFRGEQVNNYVKLDNALWRVVKITSTNEIELVLNDPLMTPVPWDDRYNEEASYNAGKNSYATSRIKEKLNEVYTTSDDTITKYLLSDKDKSRLASFNLCSGKRSLTETAIEQAVECREQTQNVKLGLLTAYEFMLASTDANCKTTSSLTCQNYNYLMSSTSYWLVTASPEKTDTVYMVEGNSGIKQTKTNMYARLRPVIHLNANVLYKSGTGTQEDPYIVK